MSSNDLAAANISTSRYDVAVLVPCYNAARAIAKVGGGRSARPPHLQPVPDRFRRAYIRPRLHRHPVRLPRLLAPLRKIVSDTFGRLRDRDGIDRACARAR